MARAENEFERRVRESEEALDRQALPPGGKRPVIERWWWIALVTAGMWPRLLGMLLGWQPADRADLITTSTLLAVAIAAFVLARRSGEHRRAALRARLGEQQEGQS